MWVPIRDKCYISKLHQKLVLWTYFNQSFCLFQTEYSNKLHFPIGQYAAWYKKSFPNRQHFGSVHVPVPEHLPAYSLAIVKLHLGEIYTSWIGQNCYNKYRVQKRWRHKKLFLDFSVLDTMYRWSMMKKHPQPKLGGNRFMGARDMATWIPN